MAMGVVFGVVLLAITGKVFWIAIGVALGAAGAFGKFEGSVDLDDGDGGDGGD